MKMQTPKFTAGIIIFLLLLDLGSKIWVRVSIPLFEIQPLIPNLIDLTHVQNRGISFSFMSDWPELIRLPLLIGVSTFAVGAMIFYLVRYWKSLDIWTWQAIVWILPGAGGNHALSGYPHPPHATPFQYFNSIKSTMQCCS